MEQKREYMSVTQHADTTYAQDAIIDINNTKETIESTTIQTALPLHPQTATTDAQMKWLLSFRFLHPAAWFVLFCI